MNDHYMNFSICRNYWCATRPCKCIILLYFTTRQEDPIDAIQRWVPLSFYVFSSLFLSYRRYPRMHRSRYKADEKLLFNGHRIRNQIFRKRSSRRTIANLITGLSYQDRENSFLFRQRDVNPIFIETTVPRRNYNLARISVLFIQPLYATSILPSHFSRRSWLSSFFFTRLSPIRISLFTLSSRDKRHHGTFFPFIFPVGK